MLYFGEIAAGCCARRVVRVCLLHVHTHTPVYTREKRGLATNLRGNRYRTSPPFICRRHASDTSGWSSNEPGCRCFYTDSFDAPGGTLTLSLLSMGDYIVHVLPLTYDDPLFARLLFRYLPCPIFF